VIGRRGQSMLDRRIRSQGHLRRARRGRRHGAAGVRPPELGGSHLGSARTLGACLDLELDALAADEPVKIQ